MNAKSYSSQNIAVMWLIIEFREQNYNHYFIVWKFLHCKYPSGHATQ